MHSLKRATKACLRPFYRRLVKPLCRPLMRRLRDFLVAPYHQTLANSPPEAALLLPTALDQAVQSLAGGLQAVHHQLAVLAAHTAQVHHLANEVATRTRHFEGTIEETDGLLLALLRAASFPRSEGAARPFDALYLGGGRLLASHPRWPFMYLDADDPLVTPRALRHTYEPGVRAVLERLVKAGDTVVEAGAGQGCHTLTLAAQVAPASGRVLAFEPNPRPRGLLGESLRCNGLEHVVQVRSQAVGPAPGPVRLPAGPGAATSLEEAAVRLDDVLEAEGVRPDFIRLNVGRAAGGALEGMWRCLEASTVKLMFPFCPARLEHAGLLPPAELLGRLAGLDFQFWSAAEDGSLERLSAGEVMERFNACWGELLAARELD